MILSAAQTELRARGFSYLTTGRDVIMLNRGKNTLESLYPWPWLEASTTGTGTVTISDLRAVLYVRDTTLNAELQGANREWIRRALDPDLSTTGVPAWWYLDGSTDLKLYPASSSTGIAVQYIKWSPELADVSDTPLIPTREHSVWIDFAAVEAYKDAENYAAANTLLGNLLSTEVPRMVNAYLGRNLQNPGFTIQTGC